MRRMRTAACSAAAAKRGPAIDVIGCARRVPGWKRKERGEEGGGEQSGTTSGSEAARSQQQSPQRRLGRRAHRRLWRRTRESAVTGAPPVLLDSVGGKVACTTRRVCTCLQLYAIAGISRSRNSGSVSRVANNRCISAGKPDRSKHCCALTLCPRSRKLSAATPKNAQTS